MSKQARPLERQRRVGFGRRRAHRRRGRQKLRAAHRAFLLRDGARLAEGPVAQVLNRAQLEALYGAPVEQLSDADTGGAAFLPGW